MALLIQSGTLQSERVVPALHATFDLRATHSAPKALDPPPADCGRTIFEVGDRVPPRTLRSRRLPGLVGILHGALSPTAWTRRFFWRRFPTPKPSLISSRPRTL